MATAPIDRIELAQDVMPLGHLLLRSARRDPGHEALVFPDTRLTYSELKARVDAFAAGLMALGLAPGDRIGIWSPNNSEWAITQFATAKAGLILVNINPAYRLSELEYALNKVGCKALVTAQSYKSSRALISIPDGGSR